MTERVFPGYLTRVRATNGTTNVTIVATERSRERVLWLMNHLGDVGSLTVTAREQDAVSCKAKYLGLERRSTSEGTLFVILFEVDSHSAPIQDLASLVNEHVAVTFSPAPKPQPKTYPDATVEVVDLRRAGPIGPQQQMGAAVRTAGFAMSEAEAEAMGMRKPKSKEGA